eukprot:224221_1
MEHAMESISIRQGGIDDVTQGDVTIIENNKQLYQSLKHESFSAMKNILRPELLDGCDKMNFVHPSKIQAEAIPRCLNNNNNLYPNFIGQAHHGSGKTATFTLIMLQRIDENISKLQGLVIVHSRTYPPSIKHLATEIAPNAIIIKIAKKNVQLDNIKIFRIICESEIDKFNTLLRVISLSNIGQMIIFVNTIVKAKQLIDGLERNSEIGIACSALYGRGMDIKIRDKTMEQFRKNQTQCLIASNVIARGIDVPAVGLVVNFEIPKNNNKFDSETFMHRVGRTGRFGSKGVCINLVSKDDSIGNDRLDAIQKEYSLNITLINKDAKSIKESITSWLHDTV